MAFQTVFGSLERYEKGHIEIIDDNPKYYVFSNVFEVAGKARPWEKIAVGKNLQYVIEAIRAEGTSPWMTCAHDEFVVVMDGDVTVEYVKLETPLAPASSEGTIAVQGQPKGRRMGTIRLKRGHQALLPKGSAYRFVANRLSVMIQQTLAGSLTVEKWGEICYQ